MDRLAIKSHPTSKHRDCSLSSPTLPRATRLREGQQLLQGLEEFPFLLRGCGKTAPGQKDPVWLGVIQSLQLIIIELWIHLSQMKPLQIPLEERQPGVQKCHWVHLPEQPDYKISASTQCQVPKTSLQWIFRASLTRLKFLLLCVPLFWKRIVSPDPI